VVTCKAASKPKRIGEVSEEFLRHVVPWCADLDKLLGCGIHENLAIALTAHSPDERELLIMSYLEEGVQNGEPMFYLTANPGHAVFLANNFQKDFHAR
jgi:hypothetical protein